MGIWCIGSGISAGAGGCWRVSVLFPLCVGICGGGLCGIGGGGGELDVSEISDADVTEVPDIEGVVAVAESDSTE